MKGMKEIHPVMWFIFLVAVVLFVVNLVVNGSVITAILTVAIFYALLWVIVKIASWLRGPAR